MDATFLAHHIQMMEAKHLALFEKMIFLCYQISLDKFLEFGRLCYLYVKLYDYFSCGLPC